MGSDERNRTGAGAGRLTVSRVVMAPLMSVAGAKAAGWQLNERFTEKGSCSTGLGGKCYKILMDKGIHRNELFSSGSLSLDKRGHQLPTTSMERIGELERGGKAIGFRHNSCG